MPELNAFYLLAAVVVTAFVTEKFRAMPFLVLVFVTGLYGVAQGEAPPWIAKEFNIGFGQTIAASGLAILAGAMVARLAESSAAIAWWRERLADKARLASTAVVATIAGLGGTPISALAVLTPMIQTAGAARTRVALAASFAVNAAHGCLIPSPVPIAALAILGGDWRAALMFGVPVAAAQILLGLALARRVPAVAVAAPDLPNAQPGSRRATLGVILALVVMIGLIIGQSLGQIPSEPLGGGPIRENILGLGRPMILLWGGLGAGLLVDGAGEVALAELVKGVVRDERGAGAGGEDGAVGLLGAGGGEVGGEEDEEGEADAEAGGLGGHGGILSESAVADGRLGPNFRRRREAGAEAHPFLSGICGTTEVVTCYKTPRNQVALAGFVPQPRVWESSLPRANCLAAARSLVTLSVEQDSE